MSSSTRKFITSISRLYSPHYMSRVLSSDSTQLFKQQSVTSTHCLGYRYLSNYTKILQNNTVHRRNFSINNSAQPGAPWPPQSPSSSLRWILGTVLAIILPFAGNKWGPLLQFKQEVDTAVETIEEIVDVVEKVSEIVDKVAEGISGDLPAGGKLKKVVDLVEDVAEKTAKDAHNVGDAIDKFQEVEDKVENIVEKLGDHEVVKEAAKGA